MKSAPLRDAPASPMPESESAFLRRDVPLEVSTAVRPRSAMMKRDSARVNPLLSEISLPGARGTILAEP